MLPHPGENSKFVVWGAEFGRFPNILPWRAAYQCDNGVCEFPSDTSDVGLVDTSRKSAFERYALASGLLTEEQLNEARAALRWSGGDQPDGDAPATDRKLADKLVEQGRLNAWQASQLFEGRTKFNLGLYRIIDSIGQGGMGQVFKAEHGVLGRIVAVKVLPRKKSTPDAIASFTREIQAQAKLDHKNLVRAFDAGHDGNVYYLVTEYVPGSDLRRLVRGSGPLNMARGAKVIAQVAEGLEHAHQRGLIHRDVKPGNVLVTPEDHAKLSDLGLAGPLAGDAENDTRFGKIVGTADYLSPDHIKSPWEPTAAWDIYSLGCTLYYSVTGKVPFPGGNTADKARAHCELRPLDPRRLNPELDAEFVEVMADMMAKNPADRIQTAAEVINRLARWTGVSTSVPAATAEDRSESDVASEASDDGEQPGLDDTQSSFPEMPELAPDQKESMSQASQATHAVASAGDATSSSLRMNEPSEPITIVRPLMLLVFLPLGLAFAVMLVWWLFSLIL